MKLPVVAAFMFTSVFSISALAADTFVCEGEFATTSLCETSGQVTIQGIPLNPRDCQHTCDMHGGFKHTGCGTIDSFAANICGGATAVKTQVFPGADGNHCGYAWWSISCR
jgi:hypothetical protein